MRIIYAGTLIPHPGGSAVLGGDLVDGLARRGHDVVAIAPVTAAALTQGDPLAGGRFRVLRYLVPGFESSPNHPPSDRFRNEERDGVAGHLVPLLEAGGVDLVIAGRETFATHVPALAHRFAVPCVILVQGATLWGLLDGAYSAGERRAILDGVGAADRVIAVARHLVPHLEKLGLGRITAIPNAVNPSAFAPGPRDPALMRAHDLRDADVIVAHVSNLKDLKRPLDVAQAAVQCRGEQRWLGITVTDDDAWAAMAGVIGHPELAEDPRFAHTADRYAHHDELDELIVAWAAEHDVMEAFHALQGAGVTAGPLLDEDMLSSDPHVAARGWIRPLASRDVGTHLHIGYAFQGLPQVWWRGSPVLGEDNDYVYKKLLGLDDDYERLVAAKIIVDDYLDADGNPV